MGRFFFFFFNFEFFRWAGLVLQSVFSSVGSPKSSRVARLGVFSKAEGPRGLIHVVIFGGFGILKAGFHGLVYFFLGGLGVIKAASETSHSLSYM